MRGGWSSALRVGLVASLLGVCAGCAGVGAGPPEPVRADRFEIAGLDEGRVRVAFEALQAAVAREDREAVAAQVAYPLRVGGRKIRTPEEMVRDYRAIWTPAVQRLVLAQRFDELFVNLHGVMLGGGAIWLAGVCPPDSPSGGCDDPAVRVTAVNPDAAR